jgi:beta-carotene ketolase (CrtW type)
MPESKPRNQYRYQGMIIAMIIILSWMGFLFLFLLSEISQLHPAQILLVIWWQTFLYTGLFITGHEAMHGLVYPDNLQINNLIGSLSVSLYGFFSYEKLLTKHWLHHNHPASVVDPDFHNGHNSQFWAWYFHFLQGYWSWWRIGTLVVIFSLISYGLQISPLNLLCFVLLPSILSSLHLFYFGTFLPHREPEGGYSDAHRVQSNNLPIFWSFLTCYHFGYHKEHHENIHTPWWKLLDLVEVKRFYL